MAADTTFVIEEADVEPVRRDGDTATVRVTFSASNGSERLEQRIVRYAPGRSAEHALDGRQEILYVAAGEGQLEIGRELHELRPGTGAFITPGETYSIENPGPGELVVVSVLAPIDQAEATAERKVTVHLEDQPELPASSERTFRYLVNEDMGCLAVTQFVGTVHPSKAPMHSHSYDEVGYVVEGQGVAHVGGESTPIRAGSCFHLPPEEIHCIENSGTSIMRILGVFHPSGSPASRAYQDNN